MSDRDCNSYTDCYEDNPKHALKRRGEIARRPTNGTLALSNSVQISPRRRISYDTTNKELVVLSLHRIDEEECVKYYHGYVIEEHEQLKNRQDIITSIKKAGYPLPK